MLRSLKRWIHIRQLADGGSTPPSLQINDSSWPSFSFNMYYVYAIYSKSFNKIYVGYTSDLEARLTSHNYLATKGFTIKYRPWVLIYSEEFNLKSDAIKREKELKTAQGREFIWNIITNSGA